MRVLLVEDSPGDARLFAELARDIPGQPFQLTTVGTFAAGLAVAAQHDVVFLDLSLPDAHGVTNVAKLVAVARSVPIVVLTGNDDEHVAVEAMKCGAQDYLHKSEITPSLIARSARYAVERKATEENLVKLAKSDEAARRAKLISSITAAISASFDTSATLQEVARLLVPTLGDVAVIDMLHDTHLERVAIATADPAHEDIARRGVHYVGGAAHPNSPVTRALEQRAPLLIDTFDAAAHAPDAQYREVVAALGVRSVFVVPLIARERVVGALTLSMNARSFTEELQQLTAEVAERIALGVDNARLYHAAQRAIRGRDELLAVVSHDLRNPLNLVGLALQMLEQDPSALASALPSAKRGVDRMQRLIEDLLDVARIDSGTLSVEPRPVALTSILDEMFEQHRVLAADKKINLVRAYDRRPGGALADRHRIAQALSNLIGNAIKFTPAGGSIKLGGELCGDHAMLWISDTGPGIPPEHLPHVFDRFWQPTRGRDGVGLGLAIVKGIVDAHGGSIDVDSQPGIGTTFRVSLRAAEARATQEMPPLALAH